MPYAQPMERTVLLSKYIESCLAKNNLATGKQTSISRCRTLLSEIPDELTEKMQLDMVYGLLDRRIRKRVMRDSLTTFDDFIRSARIVQRALQDSEKKSIKKKTQNSKKIGMVKRRYGVTSVITTATPYQNAEIFKRKKERTATTALTCYGLG